MSAIPIVAERAPRREAQLQVPQESPRPRRWTMDECLTISELGMLPRRMELLDGEILEMLARNNPHMISVSKSMRVLAQVFDEEHYWLQIQGTSRLDDYNAPEPDFAVLDGPPRDRGNAMECPLLVIEISDSTLLFDQVVKGGLYASKQILDYWIVNIPGRHVEVYRDPVQEPSRKYGWRYASMTPIRRPGHVVPLCRPDAKLKVARMLP